MGEVEEKPKKKKRSSFSSTAETLKWAREIYGDSAVCISSWWQTRVRKDLFGFIDAVVLDGRPGVLALQACGTDVGAHMKKMAGEIDGAELVAERVRLWLSAGNRLLIVSWRPIWVTTSARHKIKKMMPRFVEGVLEGGAVAWRESEGWPCTQPHVVLLHEIGATSSSTS